MKKIILICLIIISSFTGCSTSFQGNANVLKLPKNNSLLIKGTWIIEDKIEINGKKIMSDDINIDNDISIDNKVIFGVNSAYVDGQKYSNVHYKLKVVDSEYTISYEYNKVLSDYVDKDKYTDVYSILSEDKLICELFLIEEDIAIVSYKQKIIPIRKVSDKVENESSKTDTSKEDDESQKDEDRTGLMIALKSKDGDEYKYRTLWIPYYNKKLGTIYELEGITFPRRDGIYKIESVRKQINGFSVDHFRLITPDKKDISLQNESVKSNIYRNITFLSNDFIGLEESTDNVKDIENVNLKVLPVKNLNSRYGITIQELYGNYSGEDYKNSIMSSIQEIGVDVESINKIDYTNYTLYRESGKWNLYSKVDLDSKDEVVKLSLKPNLKLVNYDTLGIPWKNLKAEFPLMKDVFISPVQDIAIIILNDSIGIYEIKDGSIVSRPLYNIPIGKNEEVIMAEWCTGFYVPFWETSFLNGKAMN